MKKLLVILLTGVSLLGLAGCGKEPAKNATKADLAKKAKQILEITEKDSEVTQAYEEAKEKGVPFTGEKEFTEEDFEDGKYDDIMMKLGFSGVKQILSLDIFTQGKITMKAEDFSELSKEEINDWSDRMDELIVLGSNAIKEEIVYDPVKEKTEKPQSKPFGNSDMNDIFDSETDYQNYSGILTDKGQKIMHIMEEDARSLNNGDIEDPEAVEEICTEFLELVDLTMDDFEIDPQYNLYKDIVKDYNKLLQAVKSNSSMDNVTKLGDKLVEDIYKLATMSR